MGNNDLRTALYWSQDLKSRVERHRARLRKEYRLRSLTLSSTINSLLEEALERHEHEEQEKES